MSIESTEAPPRPPCPAPANFAREVDAYDRHAEVGRWAGPRHRMTYRRLGQGPPLVLVPGIASTYRSYALLLNKLAERFSTVVFDYPGDDPADGARLGRITHEHLVDDLFGLFDHLRIGRAFLFGPSFGSTIVFKALRREPRRFPKAAVQGGFAYRRFSPAERLALRLGRLVPGSMARLPLREKILDWNNKAQFPTPVVDRWPWYVEDNGRTPIGPFAHRLDLLAGLDLRSILKDIPVEVLLLQGNEDRVVTRPHFDELLAGLPNAQGAIMPMVGHQPHVTHAEALASTLLDFFLPCAPGGCPGDRAEDPGR